MPIDGGLFIFFANAFYLHFFLQTDSAIQEILMGSKICEWCLLALVLTRTLLKSFNIWLTWSGRTASYVYFIDGWHLSGLELYQIRWCQNWKITSENHDWFDLMAKLYSHCDVYFFPVFCRKLFGIATRICKTGSVSFSFGNLDSHRGSFESSDLTCSIHSCIRFFSILFLFFLSIDFPSFQFR